MKKVKSINDLTRQRNAIQEWLISSGAWKRHPTLYKKAENAWQTYVSNIEFFTKKNLIWHGFNSTFASTRYPKSIYNMKRKKSIDDVRIQYKRMLKMRYPKVRFHKDGTWNFNKAYPNVNIEEDAWFCKVRNIYNKMLGL